MQAIQTKYVPATNLHSSRIRALCERGTMFVPYSYEGDTESAHVAAAQSLVNKFLVEDEKNGRGSSSTNPWNGPRVVGVLRDGTYAHIILPLSK